MLETIKDLSDKHMVLAGDFNFFFDTSLDSYEGKLTLKKKSIAKFIELKEKLICVIFGELETLKLKDILFDRNMLLV